MTMYEVELEIRNWASEEIEADSPTDAANAAQEKNPGYAVKYVGGLQVMGRCDGCFKVILDGDDYVTDGDGIRVCQACQ